ncbi:MAG: hypothetical protein ACOC44_14435 [Promethearchaeia archaeon]
MNKKIPVIIGAAQFTQSKEMEKRLDPLGLMEKTATMAMDDTKTSNIKEKIDSIFMANIISWTYRDAPGNLGNRLGLELKEKHYLPIGGNTPQYMLNKAAELIETGEIKGALLVGGEANYSTYKAKKEKYDLDWPKRQKPSYVDKTQPLGLNSFVKRYNLLTFPNGYALIETALRAAQGLSVEEYLNQLGELFAEFSSVAATNPHAWSQKSYTKEEIINPTPKNRLINHPYTKRMVSNLYVDMSAAVLITSTDVASELNIPFTKWVYPMGGANLMNIKYMLQRPKLYTSPAIRYASELALKQADLSLEDIHAFDLYSCFPCMVQIAQREIGIPKDDPRPLTLTGGLPFFGGPFNNYSMHGIVEAINFVRDNPNKKAMVLANGGYNTKQSIAVYGSEPGKRPWNDKSETKKKQALIDKHVLPEPIKKANGLFEIKGYTIIYNRDGSPKKGLVLAKDMNSNRRTYAFIKAKNLPLKNFATEDHVGKRCRLEYDKQKSANHCMDLQ